jgi:hypothetical protein
LRNNHFSMRAARLVGGLALLTVTALGSVTAVAAAPLTAATGADSTDPRHGDDEDCDTVAGRDQPSCSHGLSRRFLQEGPTQQQVLGAATGAVTPEAPMVAPLAIRGTAALHHGDDSDCDTVDGKDGPLCNGHLSSQ